MIEKTLLNGLRKIYRVVAHPDFAGNPWPKDEEWETTNLLLTDLFSADKPCFVGRIGTTEQAVLVNYITVHSDKSYIRKCIDYITDNTRLPFWDLPRLSEDLCTYSGFFPRGNLKDIEKFAELYLKDIPTMDVCGRFSYPEKFLPFSKDCKMVQLESLYPFFAKKPWMKVFEGKKILVIHPFKDTILSQYNLHRRELFHNPDVLPDFRLEVIRAVQTIAGEKCRFADWFAALDYMKNEVLKHDFDLLIVGCGAYGLPLAAFAKSIGKRLYTWAEELSYCLELRVRGGKSAIMATTCALRNFLMIIGFIRQKMNGPKMQILLKEGAIGNEKLYAYALC